MKWAMEDERCAAVLTNPTFRPMRRKEAKMALDSKMKLAMEDKRFTAARTDPRFRPMRREAKVALDSRFTPMLTDPMFDSSEAPVDKRGRRRKKSARDNPMLHFFLNQEEVDEKDTEKTVQEKLIREEDHELEEEDGPDEEESYSSDYEEQDDDQYSAGSDLAHHLMARHDDTPMIDKETHMLAVVNMDWDHIKAPLSCKQPVFETRALQRTKVKPTWDDDEPECEILRQTFKDKFDLFGKHIASGESASEDDSGDESPNDIAKRKLRNKERLALLRQGNNSDEERTDDQDMEMTFSMELEDLCKLILERKSIETKIVREMHREKMKEKRKARKSLSKDDEYSDQDSADDFLANSDEEVKPMKKPKVKAKGKGKDNSRDVATEEKQKARKRSAKNGKEIKPVKKEKVKAKGKGKGKPATKEELDLLVAAGQDAGAKGYNLKCKSKMGKKGNDSGEDRLGDIDLSKDERFSPMFTSRLYALDHTDPRYKRSATSVRKQAGKKGPNVRTLDSEPPVEESSPPDRASMHGESADAVCFLMSSL